MAEDFDKAGSGSRLSKVELTEASQAQIERFRREHDTQVLTILLSDLEGSTRLQEERGNVRAAEIVRAHREVFRQTLADFDGEEVETAGDSFLVVLAAPSEGVRFALFLHAALRTAREAEPDLPELRVGIHQGQVVVDRHDSGPKAMDVYGLQVSTAARITDLGRGGQILCSRAVFDDARAILRGDQLAGLGTVAWRNHGPYRFKGVEDTYDVCEVGEEKTAPLAAPPAGSKGWPADESMEELGWRPAAGVVVPGTGWRLTERLGRDGDGYRGEFGEVWRAYNPADRSEQAFKFCFKRNRVPALKREARLLKRLRTHRHPGLVEVYDVTEGDRPPYYLEMEYVEGPSLAEWIGTDPPSGPPSGERLEVVAQVADALDTVHAAGIYHRDIKPSNILLTRRQDGSLRAKLTDFGLGAAEDEDLLRSIKVTRVAGVAGTWDYIAPELREGGSPSAQSDIYSLGVTLYQVVAGDLLRPLTGDWERLVPSEVLREDIRRCVAGEPDRRWPRASELATALRSHDQRLELMRQEEEAKKQANRARRLRTLVALVSLFAIVTIGLGGLATMQWFEARAQRDRAELNQKLADNQRDEARHQLGIGFVERAAMLDRDGRPVVAYLTAARAIGFAGLEGDFERYEPLVRPGSDAWLRAEGIMRSNPPPVVWKTPSSIQLDFAVGAVAWHPDGEILATAGPASALKLWNTRSGEEFGELDLGFGSAESLAFSPDGSLLAVGGFGGEISLLGMPGGEMLGRLSAHTREVGGVSFSPDGRLLASRSADGTVKLWNMESREEIRTLEVPADGFNQVAFRPDGAVLAAPGPEGAVRRFEIPGLRPLPPFTGLEPSSGPPEFPDGNLCLAYAPDGSILAVGEPGGRIHLFDTETARALRILSGHPDSVNDLSFRSDGHLASAGNDDTARIWNPRTGELVATCEGHTLDVECVAFSPDGRTLTTGSKDCSVRSFDAETGAPRGQPAGHTGPVWEIAVTPDGATLVSASEDGTVRLWDAATGKPLERFAGFDGTVRSVDVTRDGSRFLSASEDGRLTIRELPTGRLHREHSLVPIALHSARFSPDGRHFAVAGMFGSVLIGESETGRIVYESGDHLEDVWELAFSPDGTVLATAGDDGVVRLIRFGTQVSVDRLEGHVNSLRAVAFSPDGTHLASGGMDGTAILWDVASGKEVTRFTGDTGWILSVAFSPDGSVLATGSADSTIRLHDIATRRRIARLDDAAGGVNGLVFSPDGRSLYSGTAEAILRKWDLTGLRRAGGLAGGMGTVRALEFSPDRSLVVGVGWGAMVKLWSTLLGRPVAEYAGPSQGLGCVAFDPKGRRIASGGWDGKVRIQNVADGTAETELDHDSEPVTCLAFGPDGERLAVGLGSGAVVEWNLGERRVLRRLPGVKGPVGGLTWVDGGKSLAVQGFEGALQLYPPGNAESPVEKEIPGGWLLVLSPDGSSVARGTREGEIEMVSVDSGEVTATLVGHRASVTGLRFTPDGRFLLSGDLSGILRLWDLKTNESVAIFTGHTDGVSGLAISRDGRLAVSGDMKGGVHLWHLAAPGRSPASQPGRFRFDGLAVELLALPRSLKGNPGFSFPRTDGR